MTLHKNPPSIHPASHIHSSNFLQVHENSRSDNNRSHSRFFARTSSFLLSTWVHILPRIEVTNSIGRSTDRPIDRPTDRPMASALTIGVDVLANIWVTSAYAWKKGRHCQCGCSLSIAFRLVNVSCYDPSKPNPNLTLVARSKGKPKKTEPAIESDVHMYILYI